MMKAGSIKSMPRRVAVLSRAVFLLLLITAVPCFAADDAAAGGKSSSVVSESAEAVSSGVTTLQNRISDSRLVNRTRDENVAFVLMGVLVASVAGMFSKIRSSGLGMVGRLLLGLGGAFIGGMVVRVAQLDFGWGTVTMGYEELLFSLLGAVAIVAVSRGIQYQMRKKKRS